MRRILVIFDSPRIRKEAVQYSIELAKRTDSELVFLGILPIESIEKPSASRDPETQADRALQGHIKEAITAGIAAEGEIKIGDPQSELMKFLASSSSVQTIVWGGIEDVIESGARQKKGHWLIRMKSMVECPVVVPSMKSNAVEGHMLRTQRHHYNPHEEEKK